MEFRKDINALRALAVLSVVIYHFFPSLLPGGFIGVDIFFVISGYLMTGIIITECKDGKFNLINFYIRRVKRILPALAFLCLCLLILGWFILSPLEYYSLVKHVESSLFFYSNHVYLSESGYFDVNPQEKWLLHTWSLSVEWQFYLLYPILITLIVKFSKILNIKYYLFFVFSVGFLFSIYSSFNWKEASYFLFPSRAWELILGGLVYFSVYKSRSFITNRLQLIGILLICFSLISIDSNTAWPGYMALFPVFGSFIIIFANNQNNFFSNSLTLEYIGKWSYSIYLWHWPVLALIYHSFDVNYYTLTLGILSSVILGCLSFYLIEKNKIPFFNMLLVTMTMLVSIVLVSYKGFAYQVPKSIYKASLIDPKAKEYGDYTWSRVKQFADGFSDTRPNMLLIGDSQSGDFANILYFIGAFDKYEVRSTLISAKCGAFYISEELRKEFFNISTDIIKGKVSKKLCIRQWDQYYDSDILSDAAIIFIAMNWRDYSSKYISHSISKIRVKNPHAKIFVVGPKALGANIPTEMYRAYKQGRDVNSVVYQKFISKYGLESDDLKSHILSFDDVYYIDLREFLCDVDNEMCRAVINDSPTFYDGPHTTYIGNKYLSTYVKNFLEEKGVNISKD